MTATPSDQDRQTTNSQAARTRLSEAIVLAVIPVLAYAYVLHYEAGYAIAYGFPQDFIKLDFVMVLQKSEIFVLLALVLIVLVGVLPVAIFWLVFLLSVPVWLIVYGAFFAEDAVHRWAAIAAGIAWLGGLVLLVLEVQRPAETTAESQPNKKRPLGDMMLFVIARFLGFEKRSVGVALFVLWLLLMTMEFPRSLGERHALLGGEYLVTGTQPELILLRQYSDYAVCAPFDRRTGQITRQYVLVPVGDASVRWTTIKVSGIRVEAPQELTPVRQPRSDTVVPTSKTDRAPSR